MNLFTSLLFGTTPQPQIKAKPLSEKRKVANGMRRCITCNETKARSEFGKYGYECALCKPVEPKTRGHYVSEEAMQKVLDVMSFDKYESPVEIAKRCGYTVQHVRHALKKLRDRKEVTRRTLKYGHINFIRIRKCP